MSLSAIMNSTTLYIAVIVGLLLIFLLCAVTVSYTHLDVYKRQAPPQKEA